MALTLKSINPAASNAGTEASIAGANLFNKALDRIKGGVKGALDSNEAVEKDNSAVTLNNAIASLNSSTTETLGDNKAAVADLLKSGNLTTEDQKTLLTAGNAADVDLQDRVQAQAVRDRNENKNILATAQDVDAITNQATGQNIRALQDVAKSNTAQQGVSTTANALGRVDTENAVTNLNQAAEVAKAQENVAASRQSRDVTNENIQFYRSDQEANNAIANIVTAEDRDRVIARLSDGPNKATQIANARGKVATGDAERIAAGQRDEVIRQDEIKRFQSDATTRFNDVRSEINVSDNAVPGTETMLGNRDRLAEHEDFLRTQKRPNSDQLLYKPGEVDQIIEDLKQSTNNTDDTAMRAVLTQYIDPKTGKVVLPSDAQLTRIAERMGVAPSTFRKQLTDFKKDTGIEAASKRAAALQGIRDRMTQDLAKKRLDQRFDQSTLGGVKELVKATSIAEEWHDWGNTEVELASQIMFEAINFGGVSPAQAQLALLESVYPPSLGTSDPQDFDEGLLRNKLETIKLGNEKSAEEANVQNMQSIARDPLAAQKTRGLQVQPDNIFNNVGR